MIFVFVSYCSFSKPPLAPPLIKNQQAIDPVRKIYYVAAYNKTSEVMSLRGMSLSTGNVVNEIVLPFKPTPFETYVLSLDYKVRCCCVL